MAGCLDENAMYDSGEICVLELPRGKIHGHFIGPRPSHRFAARGSQHPFTDWDNETAFLGEGNELAGQDQTVLRMMPTARSRSELDRMPSAGPS